MKDKTRENAEKFILNDGGYFKDSIANEEFSEKDADDQHYFGTVYICDECSKIATREEGVKTVVYHLR